MMQLGFLSPPSETLAIGASVPIGVSAAVLIGGTNDTPTAQQMGARWEVTDPDGIVVDSYEDWEMWPYTGPGAEHGFVGNRFDLNKLGTYTLKADLLMNRDEPVTVDSYDGDLCAVTPEVPPEYELIQHTIHPASYVWEGEDEVCVIEFPLTPDQLPFTQWGGLKLAETFANAIEAEGNSILELKVYEDTTPLLWTNYRVEIKAAVASEEQSIGVWPWVIAIGAVLASLPWKAIIIGALSVLGIWIVGWVIEKLIKAVDRVIHKPPALTDEVIDELGREDLIPMILYKAPRVEYEVTPEELEAMSDDGLRALLKELRDRQAPPPIEWLPLVLIAGVGVVGVGAAAVALTARRKE